MSKYYQLLKIYDDTNFDGTSPTDPTLPLENHFRVLGIDENLDDNAVARQAADQKAFLARFDEVSKKYAHHDRSAAGQLQQKTHAAQTALAAAAGVRLHRDELFKKRLAKLAQEAKTLKDAGLPRAQADQVLRKKAQTNPHFGFPAKQVAAAVTEALKLHDPWPAGGGAPASGATTGAKLAWQPVLAWSTVGLAGAAVALIGVFHLGAALLVAALGAAGCGGMFAWLARADLNFKSGRLWVRARETPTGPLVWSAAACGLGVATACALAPFFPDKPRDKTAGAQAAKANALANAAASSVAPSEQKPPPDKPPSDNTRPGPARADLTAVDLRERPKPVLGELETAVAGRLALLAANASDAQARALSRAIDGDPQTFCRFATPKDGARGPVGEFTIELDNVYPIDGVLVLNGGAGLAGASELRIRFGDDVPIAVSLDNHRLWQAHALKPTLAEQALVTVVVYGLAPAAGAEVALSEVWLCHTEGLAAAGAQWQGGWKMADGDHAQLRQQGNWVWGDYAGVASLVGRASGNRLIGLWQNGDAFNPPGNAGALELTRSNTEEAFTGRWKSGFDSGWQEDELWKAERRDK